MKFEKKKKLCPRKPTFHMPIKTEEETTVKQRFFLPHADGIPSLHFFQFEYI